MSRRSDTVAAETCTALGADDARIESYPNRELSLGSLAISRALPVKQKRLVGPWCFLDRFGPLTFSEGKPMDVAPHPHIGLQTVTWLLQGEVVHDDSLGYESILRPGGVNVMTSGDSIAHAEQTPPDNTGQLNGVQLWVALPDSQSSHRRHFRARCRKSRPPSRELVVCRYSRERCKVRRRQQFTSLKSSERICRCTLGTR